MPKEYTLIAIAGLFLLGYLLDAVVDPLALNLITPYHFLQAQHMTTYPFTTASVIIKSIGLFLSPLWMMSFIKDHFMGKFAVLLVLASLMQLYAIQEVATNAQIIPLEWSLSLSIAGVCLLLPALIYFIRGIFFSLSQNLTTAKMEAAIEQSVSNKTE